jgi:hypothetical protein
MAFVLLAWEIEGGTISLINKGSFAICCIGIPILV